MVRFYLQKRIRRPCYLVKEWYARSKKVLGRVSASQDDQSGCFVCIDHLIQDFVWINLVRRNFESNLKVKSVMLLVTLKPTVILALPKSPCISLTYGRAYNGGIIICIKYWLYEYQF